ncbi:Pls/PosA family non-ribosomal peptide synthetase [Amycolatopsis sp. NPDC005232]|uniref:Pls/PosA family non-ribosomal peptide synthetase n=1 Tax=Amycolatopsis sp. NPDC005232 TaxID=3157027 RepID=UPI0033BF674A
MTTSVWNAGHGGMSNPDRSPLLVGAEYSPGRRTRPGERLHEVFEERVDWMRSFAEPAHLAVDAGGVTLTYPELDERANQLARYLLTQGARAGDRIGLLFDQAVHTYVAMLAVSKIHAAYVPLDVGFPPDRIHYIVSDAHAHLVLTTSGVHEQVYGLEDIAPQPLYLDAAAARIAGQAPSPLTDVERGDPVDDLAYLIYTSGTTGRPKGVAISHASICNFVRVAAEVYGIRADDRVYQGMTIAFDFAVEEIWVPWISGATLVPKPAGPSLVGLDMHEFLTEHHVSAMCVVPTLLATIEEDLPELRFLLVSGEACPQDLIRRWHRPGRRFLNVYGPTEATVTATWTTLDPDRAVTIGQPLPTYTAVILDPEDPSRALPFGEVGEIGLAGIGLAQGYLNRPDLTEKAFVPDVFGVPENPSGRVYRTGDIGRVNESGEIEYHGRIDLQVKVRGYRIELPEIETVLMQVPGVAAAVVDTFEPTPGAVELVGYYTLRRGVRKLEPDTIYHNLRQRLPSYMVPAYLEPLAFIPMTTAGKIDRKALPAPASRRRTAGGTHVAPASETERLLADALAATLGLEDVSVESQFFDDLGANSLLLAQFSARVRKTGGLPSLSMREIYQNPTIRRLGKVLDPTGTGVIGPGPKSATRRHEVARASSVRYLATGAAQLVALATASYVGALLLARGFVWSKSATTLLGVFARSGGNAVVDFLAICLLPILAKWTLIGRFTPREIRLWSVQYFRFWLVKTLLTISPMVLFAGTPIFSLYLRALGAKVGRGATILSASVPVATDLITIGRDTVIRRTSSFSGYHATSGMLRTGRVTIGNDAFVGEATVIDIDVEIGDGGQLGHSSALHPGQRIPPGERWHGVPAEPTDTDYKVLADASRGSLRRFGYSTVQLLATLVVGAALSGVLVVLLAEFPVVSSFFDPTRYSLSSSRFYLSIAAISAILFLAGVLLNLAVRTTVPRLLSLFVRPGRTYRLYGVRHLMASAIIRLSNSRFFMMMFGDSSAAVPYTRGIGYHQPQVEQTGSNFGTEIRQDSALLTTVGTGTMLSDGISIMNADFSSATFRMSPIAIGARNFIGNNISLPTGARIGDNVLLATKVMVPIDGPVRENVGLLGSPPFEIPRSVARDSRFDHLKTPQERRRRLAAKLRHNIGSMAVFIAFRFVRFFAFVLIMTISAGFYQRFAELALTAGFMASAMFNILLAAFAERVVLGFHRLVPRFVSIHDPNFWRHERLWKVLAVAAFAGTPFRTLHWRLLGVRVGKRLFDDGSTIPEKTLVTLGDDVLLNAGSVIQCHSLEDGTFKSDYTTLGDGVVVGMGAFVHYGVTMGDGSVLEADGFLMKGEETAPFTRWSGNPATETRAATPEAQLRHPPRLGDRGRHRRHRGPRIPHPRRSAA